MEQFSKRTGWDTEESPFAIATRVARAAGLARGRPIVDLTVSNPTVCGFEYDPEPILGPLGNPQALVYDPDARGMRRAREAVASYYADHGAVEVDPEALTLTTSTSEAYGYLFRLLCDAGDEVLVAQPSYPLFDFLADLEDVQLRTYPLFYDYGWWIDFGALEERIGPRTRAILIVHPNNPTGHATRAAERLMLEEICLRHSLVLIVDEVFLDYPVEMAAEDLTTFATGPHPVLTFVLSGMSKIAGLPQMKVGWIATFGKEDAKAGALNRLMVIADTFLSMNTPAQLALPVWLGGRRFIQQQILRRVQTNLTVARIADIDVLRVDAGWSAILRIEQQGELDGLALKILGDTGVMMHPGVFYGMAEGGRLVISLIGPGDPFQDAISRITEWRLRQRQS